MRLTLRAFSVLLFCLSASAGFSEKAPPVHLDRAADSLLQSFFSDFNLPAAADAADVRLRHTPKDAMALFIRMETAELQERPEVALDSALRLCALPAAPELHELASNRVLQHAANSWAFNLVLRRIKLAAAVHNGCTFNLRLALVAAASDGANIDLDMAAHSSGLLTQWTVAGPFGRYNNVDFERHWAPESERAFRDRYSSQRDSGILKSEHRGPAAATPDSSRTIVPERYWFRDGMIALPEYLFSSGIFYAASEVDLPAATISRLEILSSGTYEVFVDGKSALLHDGRYAAAPTRDSSSLSMAAGHHRILLKFSTDAAPLSVALHSQFEAPPQKKIVLPAALEQYMQTLAAYFRGDFAEMATLLRADALRDAASSKYLHALLYSAAEEHSPRADAAWKALATAQPGALLARLKSDQNAVDRGQPDAVRADIMSILAERPQSETALQLAFNLTRRNQVDGPALLTRLLESHASCARLADAVKFYNAAAQQDKSRAVEQQVASCAPESLQYARLLAESGRHSAAAAYLQQLVTRNPFHRAARRLLMEQLLLDNQISAAKLQAKQLREMAANARDYVPMVRDTGVAPDSRSERAEGFASGAEFYVPYRRDGIEMVRNSAQRSFSGGEAVILLSDKVVRIRRNGPISVYVHRIIRPLNKEGISRYGEVTLPRGADLLELRTIKSSGEIIEPELAQQKPTISMPALEPGDAIEEEYMLHYAELDQMPENAGAHIFGSFAAPILHARMVLLCPAESTISVREQAGPPLPLVGENNGVVIRIWERDNIAQTIAEPFLPAVNLLPTVTVASAEKTHDGLRDQLIDASRAGLHVNEAAAEFNLSQAGGDAERARRLYRFVTSKIDSTGPDWAASPAEDTLDNGQGSRTMALLALARAVGLNAELFLARKIEQNCGKELSCYTEPLVRFWLQNGESVDVDAESDDLPFGAIPPSLDAREAHLIPLLPDEEKKTEIVALNPRLASEKSVAEADLSFPDGNLVATINVQLGSMRAQEVRNLLRNAGEREKQAFFEQLAMRIFPGAASVTGTAAHQNDPEQPLKLSIRWTIPQFINWQSGAAEINQLAPALGLATLYAKTSTRKFPLLIESLFFESTVFHLHLPQDMEVHSMPSDFIEKTEFGEYALRFVRLPHQIDIHRDFRIPVQIIAPEKYAAFVKFALRIDEAEHQRISLESRKNAASVRPTTAHKN
jgi:tetratricopeptide (TPR) repeat protein